MIIVIILLSLLFKIKKFYFNYFKFAIQNKLLFHEIYANANEIQRIIDQFLYSVIELYMELIYEGLNLK
jgi:hypothetical protein